MKKADYGIDAPGVIRNLFIFLVIGFLVKFCFPIINIGNINFDLSGFLWMGSACGLMGLWMLLYSMYGKLKHKDHILNMINWSGNEIVLDVGTGRGLLMIGAAKKLSSGKSIGIDIWNEEDLAKNKIENTTNNAIIEGVNDRVEILNENVTSMSFADNTFDIVISNLCLHNIYNIEERKKACIEIGRVLKKGGIGIISDFKHVKEYNNNFEKLGMQTEFIPASYLTTYPPLPILKIKKNWISVK